MYVVTNAVCLFLVGENLPLNTIFVRKYLPGQGSGLHVSDSRPSQGCPPFSASRIIDLFRVPVPHVLVQSVQFDILQSTTTKKAYHKTCRPEHGGLELDFNNLHMHIVTSAVYLFTNNCI
jgi:hypothetical protein